MNIPRLVIAIFVVAVVSYLFNFLYHGLLLGSSYQETSAAWRPQSEMLARIPLQLICYVIVSIGFCTIWAFALGGKGVRYGLIYGFFIGLVAVGGMLINFVFLPIPDQFMLPWIGGGLLSAVLSGVIAALVYKPKQAAK